MAESKATDSELTNKVENSIRHLIATGMPAADVAERVVRAIREEQLYILTHVDYKPMLETHMKDVIAERNPDVTQQVLSARVG